MDIEKLRLIKSTSELMLQMPLGELNLVMYEAELGEIDPESWNGDNHWQPDAEYRRGLGARLLRDQTRSQVQAIGTALRQLNDAEVEVEDDSEPIALRLFASHLTTRAAFVSQVAAELEQWNISLFVAHARSSY